MVNKLYVAKSPNLSLAWAEVLLHLLDRGVTNLSPAVITISDFDEHSLPRHDPRDPNGYRCVQQADESHNCQHNLS